MAKREQSDSAQLKLRIKEPLRQRLEEAARANGISLNSEIAHRLELSFNNRDVLWSVFGSPEVGRVALFAGLAFGGSGKMSAGEAEASEWLKHQEHHRAAIIGAVLALLDGLPDSHFEEQKKTVEALWQRIQSRAGSGFVAPHS